MYYCNDFYSLSVLSLYEGELLGVVNKLYFDNNLKKLTSIELLNDESVSLILPVKNIYNIGKNAITVKNNQAVSLKVEETALPSCPIGAKTYSIQGEYLGAVKEISLNEKYFIEKFSLDNNTTLEISSLASFGKNTIIFNTNAEKINVKKFTPLKTPKLFKKKVTQQVSIMPTETETSTTSVEEIGNQVSTPQIQNNDFLIGRICTKDIYNFNNEILIKANTTVTKKNLKEINRFSKLRELMLYLKQK